MRSGERDIGLSYARAEAIAIRRRVRLSWAGPRRSAIQLWVHDTPAIGRGIRSLETEGFAVLPRVLSAAEVSGLARLCDRLPPDGDGRRAGRRDILRAVPE